VRVFIAIVLAASQLSVSANQGEEAAAFARAVDSYVEVHRAAAVGLDASAADPEAAATLRTTLAERIRARRRAVQASDIFGLAGARIREVIKSEIAGPQGEAMLAAIHESNVQGARIRVNHRYPPGLPRAPCRGSC
jgi:hypothetical protein